MRPKYTSFMLERIKGYLYVYIVLVPLLTALFARQIDSDSVSFVASLVLVGGAFWWFRRELERLGLQVQRLEEELDDRSGGRGWRGPRS